MKLICWGKNSHAVLAAAGLGLAMPLSAQPLLPPPLPPLPVALTNRALPVRPAQATVPPPPAGSVSLGQSLLPSGLDGRAPVVPRSLPPLRPQPVGPVVSQPVAPQPAAPPPQPTLPPTSIAWDAESKEKAAKPGEVNVPFTFWLTNVCSSEVVINSVRTSCGCTVARLPSQPWRIPPGSGGPIEVTLNIQGKSGKIMKTVTIDSNAGTKNLLVTANVPAPQSPAPVSPNMAAISVDRMRNAMISKSDRQATLKGACATCHVKPAVGLLGKPLYATACAICHNAEHRATDVPDLQALTKPTDALYWRQFIQEGKTGGMMPAFAADQGGFLTPAQVESLVTYLLSDFKREGKIVYHDPHAAPKPTPPIVSTNRLPAPVVSRPSAPATNARPAAPVVKPTAQVFRPGGVAAESPR